MLAFVPSAALPFRHASSRRAALVCSSSPPPRAPSKRPLPAVIVGAVASAIALALTPFGVSPAQAASSSKASTPSKELRYDGRQELDGGEKAMSLTLTAGTFAALGVWAWKQNRRDDELENVRIKSEVERLEKLRAEFMDVEEDEETMDDEDLLASLKQRIGDQEEGEEGEGKEGTEVSGERAEGEGSEGEEDEDKEGGADVAPSGSLDMLKRMWEATDDGDDDAKKKDKP